MERISLVKSRDTSCLLALDDLFVVARQFVEDTYSKQLHWYRALSVSCMNPKLFWEEYVWVVYASGFNAKVLSKKYDSLMAALGTWMGTIDPHKVLTVIGNKRKLSAIEKCRWLLQILGWRKFEEEYCASVDTLESLPYVGPVTKYHLARNLGFDAVKPDLHLRRITEFYQFESPALLCEFLSIAYEERVGVVDYILWCYLAAHGSLGYAAALRYDS